MGVLKRQMRRYFPDQYLRISQWVKANFPDQYAKSEGPGMEQTLAVASTTQENGRGGRRSSVLSTASASGKSGAASVYSSESSELPPSVTPEEVLMCINHMSGRLLSEVQEVGMEIRSELHDVCERVAQMQMAVDELAWRTERIRSEQVEALQESRATSPR